MTDQELSSLKQLEANIKKLIDIIKKQQSKIKLMQENLDKANEENKQLKQAIGTLSEELELSKLANQILQGEGSQHREVKTFLKEIINDVDKCIKQLETSYDIR